MQTSERSPSTHSGEQGQGVGPRLPCSGPMMVALPFGVSLLSGPRLRRRFQLPARGPTSGPHVSYSVRPRPTPTVSSLALSTLRRVSAYLHAYWWPQLITFSP